MYILYFLLLGGPYSVFAGHDASRALAKFEVHLISEEYDDLSDLTQSELNEVKEWELQFSEKYTLVGNLLKPGEQPTSYSDDEGTDDEDAIAEMEAEGDFGMWSQTAICPIAFDLGYFFAYAFRSSFLMF